MKCGFLVGLMALPLMAQQAAEKPAAAEQPKPAAAETAQTPAAEAPKAATEQAPAAPAEPSPAPAEGLALTGSVDFGYRWVSDIAGSFDTYRSVVNLGSGPKLFGVDLSYESPSRRLVDRINVRGNNWGGDPYNTAHVDAVRHGWYNFNFDYRNIAYFNFLPSFADPTIGRGIFLDQRSFDTHRRMSDFELDLRPGSRIVPYLAYAHDSGFGRGITDYVSDVNEYPVANRLRDKTDNFRGGLRFEFQRFHVTVEQGGSTFKDDQQVFTNTQNFGNRTTPFFGERLFLTDLAQAYGVRGSSVYSKVLVTANPASWINLFGQFLYSRPETDVHYSQLNTGHFIDLDTLLFFDSQLALVSAEARQPHTSGTMGFELRPFKRLRIIESWMTDRLHDDSSSQLTNQVLTPALPADISDLTGRLVRDYSQQQIDVLFDLTSRLTLRGGHRYVWGEARTRGALVSDSESETGVLRRQVGLAGASYRAGRGLSVNVDFEGASGDRAYFRTSLQDYRRARIRAQYQPIASLTLSAAFAVLSNENPAPTVNYDFLSRDNSFSLVWAPKGGKRVSLTGEYSRSTLRSDITYLVPQTLDRERSFYRDNAHAGSGTLDLVMPGFKDLAPRLSLGGAFFISSGSRPTEYYQPMARFTAPLLKQLAWYAEWRWYGFGEPFYAYEAFRGHMLMTGLRVLR